MIRIHPLSCSRSVAVAAVLSAALSAGCASAPPAPPTDPGAAIPAFGGNDMPPGTHIQVARQGQWLPASVVQPLAEGRFLIHYDNTGNEWNEVVGLDRIKTATGGAPGGPGAPPPPPRDYRPGEKVLVTYQNRLLLADVVQQVSADTWRVHYDGFGPEAAENAGFERMRRPFAGASGHAVGEALVVEANGQALPAKVLAVSAADHWIVRFDGFGPEYDQEVGVDRIRASAPAVAPVPPPAASAPPPVEPPAPKPAAPPAKPEKPKPAGEAAPAAQSGPPAPTEAVLVNVHGAFFAATVTGPGANGAFKVKFATGGEDEVALDRIVREPAAKGLHYQPAQPVLVDFKGVWMPGKVLKQEGKTDYRIRFDGQGPESDEVVTYKRIRPR
jgi:hypothetical protein